MTCVSTRFCSTHRVSVRRVDASKYVDALSSSSASRASQCVKKPAASELCAARERALEVVGVEPEVDERGGESFDPRAVHRFAVAFSLVTNTPTPTALFVAADERRAKQHQPEVPHALHPGRLRAVRSVQVQKYRPRRERRSAVIAPALVHAREERDRVRARPRSQRFQLRDRARFHRGAELLIERIGELVRARVLDAAVEFLERRGDGALRVRRGSKGLE
eukprot:30837-Pelagococcus_subviridis.AAC.7